MARPLAALSLVALVLTAVASGAGGSSGAGEFTFYPQAGILWRDLYPNNFVDLDPGPGVRDFACGRQTYDGHTGTDSDIRSFREMDIGVPVFAALDGRVISVQDGEFDRNHGPTVARFDNHVVVEHGPGRFTIYGHLRKGIRLKRNDRVVAGRQLGWTASSGNSSWPHLHFTSQVASEIDEPFSGPCNEGPSGWADQAPIPADAYARDLALSAKPMTGKRDLPYDQAVRAGTFVRGTKVVYSRIEIGAMPPPGAGVLRVRFVRPSGSIAAESRMTLQTAHGRGYWWFANRVTLGRLGRWRIVIDLEGRTLADSPVDVVARQDDVRNVRRARSPSRCGRRRRQRKGSSSASSRRRSSRRIPTTTSCGTGTAGSSTASSFAQCRAPRSRTCCGRVSLGRGRACAARSLRATAACRGRPRQLRRRRASRGPGGDRRHETERGRRP